MGENSKSGESILPGVSAASIGIVNYASGISSSTCPHGRSMEVGRGIGLI